MELAIEVNVSFLLLEQPEDLGMLARGPYKGQRPASMWQWPAMDRVATLRKVTTLALHQSSFGTDYPKPTRLLLLGARHLPDFCYVGPPTYDNRGSYMGPLPRLHNQLSMRDRATPGPFKTTGTEQWPIRMCQWIAAMLLDTCSATATTANEGQEADNRADNRVEDNNVSYNLQARGTLATRWKGSTQIMRDTGRLQGFPRWRRAMFAGQVEEGGPGASGWS